MKNPKSGWNENTVTTFGYKNYGVRSERYRYIVYADGTEELYDHQKDKWEWRNLADNPEYAKMKEKMRKGFLLIMSHGPHVHSPWTQATFPLAAYRRTSNNITQMKSFKLLRLLAVLGTIVVSTFVTAARPNVVIIFTDDQGYADLACYGNTKNKTPRLDQLAKEGTRFTSFYSQTVCGPSRSALLTGRQPIRSGGWGMPAEEITWAELIVKAGYQTACIGKWDVSNRKAIIPRMPNAQGFDYFFGALGANDNGTVRFHENNEAAGMTRDMGGLIKLYTDKSIDYLKNKRDPKPFVLYLAHTMMHTIIDASPKFRGKSKGRAVRRCGGGI